MVPLPVLKSQLTTSSSWEERLSLWLLVPISRLGLHSQAKRRSHHNLVKAPDCHRLSQT